MDPENDTVASPSAEPADDAPSWATDALDALIGDDYGDVDTEPTEGEPTADAALEPEDDDAETPEPGDDSTETETDGDEPDELKELLKNIPRSKRGKVIEHFQAKAADRIKAAQEIEDRNKADAAARDAKATEIREKRGKYIGEVEGKREDGTPIPTYKDLEQLLTRRGGDDVLDDKYGLSRDEALELKETWDERKALLNDSIDDFRTEAWVESGKSLATSVAAAGLPIEAIWKDVKGIGDIVPSVVSHLTAKHQAEIAGLKKDYDSRLKAANANAPAAAARNAARTLPSPDTGGRGDASGARRYRASELAEMTSKEFSALEADIDRAYEEGRIDPD